MSLTIVNDAMTTVNVPMRIVFSPLTIDRVTKPIIKGASMTDGTASTTVILAPTIGNESLPISNASPTISSDSLTTINDSPTVVKG